jgi:vacuolar-type H+-ATPase subunit H
VTQARGFLDRFRPAGAPGAAARAGVPADRARELAVEVEPVLALLDGTHAECEQIIEAARQEADRIAAAAHAETARIGQEAERLARIARDEAAGEILARARAEASEAEAGADQQVLQIRRLAKHRLPELVNTAVGLVQAGLEGQAALQGRAGLEGRAGLTADGDPDVTAEQLL